MRFLETRVPPPLVGLGVAAIEWLLVPATPAAAPSPLVRGTLALAIALAGGAVALAGSIAFRRARTTVNPLHPEKASTLVTGGIYRHTRNPMYVGMACVLLALAAWWWWWPALLGVAAFAGWITRWQIVPEERALAALFGDAYRDYRTRVRRWL